MDKQRENVISNVRACLISFKGKVSLRQLENDYRTLIGDKIPSRELGYKSTKDFIASIPSLMVTSTSSGEWFVDAKASEKSSHITEMVSKQKAAKKRPPPKIVRFNKYQNAPKTYNWSPPVNNYKIKRFSRLERTAAVSHNQLVTRSPVKSVKSRLVIPEYSTFNKSDKPKPNTAEASPEKETLPVTNVGSPTMRGGYHLPNPNEKKMAASTTPSRLKSSNVVEEDLPLDSEKLTDSLLQTSRKRITRMMSEVSLERDSGNSSPTNETKLNNEIILTDDPIADLNNIVDYLRLGKVEVSHNCMKKKRSPTIYTCKLTVDNQTYLSYPNDFTDQNSAHIFCVKLALQDLLPKCNRKRSLLLSNSKDIKERIPPMLKPHFQAIWSWQLEADYVDKYLEQLPINWLEIIDSCDCVAVEKIQDRFLLRYCRPGTALQKGDQFTSPPLEISIPSNTVQFSENNRLYAQITCIMSLNEVWCRQWDTPEFRAFDQMMGELEKYYESEGKSEKAINIELGSYYVAYFDSTWYRVRALEIQENGVNCFLIDFGDGYLIPKDCLYSIRREFALSQAQAFVCRFAGLEDLYDASVPIEKLTSYVGAEVVLEAAQSDAEDTDTDQSIAVVMYDFANGKSINEELLQFLTIEVAMPSIKPDTINEVYVSHITEAGDVYVQIHSKGFLSLQSLLEYLRVEMDQNPPFLKAQITKASWLKNKELLYLSKDQNGLWCRSKILDMSPKGDLAQVYFVDKGNFEVIKISEVVMYPLSEISDVLYQFPAQAVRVKMALEVIPDNFVQLASKLMSFDSPTLLKIVYFDHEKIPFCDFYKRSTEGGLFCINRSIMMEVELSSKEPEHNMLKGTKSKLVKLTQLKDESLQKENVPSGGFLKRPELPKKGEYFDVEIPLVVNPWNFFVQPYSSKKQRDEMMSSLQERYKNVTFSPISISMVLPGHIYATKHTDGFWYRTSILKVIHQGSISVFYCDFGYYGSLSLNQLVPLEPDFLVLPYQALKAKLSGIKPKKNKWSMEDCEYFTELVRGRAFVSIINDTEQDELYESDPVLKLSLIDTSSDEDIFIDRELVKKDIASNAD